MSNYLKKIFGNSAWMIIANVINIIVGLVVSVFVTRYLGVEQKGKMANAQVISSFWGFIASLGLLDIMISKFSTEKDRTAEIAATGMVLMFCGGTIAFFSSLVNAVFFGVKTEILIYVAIYSCVYLFQFLSVYEYWFYSISNSKYYAVAQTVLHIIFLMIKLLCVLLQMSLLYFIIVSALEPIVIYLSLIICYKMNRCYFIGRFAFNKNVAIELIRLALPMIAMGFATTIYMKIDQLMVGKFMGDREIGLYSISVNLAEYWYFIPAIIYSSFLPIITESYSQNKEFKNKLQLFADIMISIAYLAAFGVMILGKYGVCLLYGKEFEKAASILMVYIWSGVFTCLSYSGQAYYIIHKDTKTIMWINIMGATINFLLNIILIRIYGSIGAAIATLLQYMIVAFGQMFVCKKEYRELYEIQLKSLFPFIRLYKYVENLTREKRR